MDYDAKPQVFYESIQSASIDLVQKEECKQAALQSMDELHGWCTKNKASILIDLIFLVKPDKIVEIGVWGGKSLIPMAFALKNTGKGKIYGVDPWSPQESAIGMTDANKEWWSQVNHDLVYQSLLDNVQKNKLRKFVEVVRKTSENAPEIQNIDILHIDGNHSEQTSLFDVYKWAPLVRKGGFIIFDDITWGTTTKATDWLDEHCVRIANFHEDNDWAIWIKP